MRKLKIKLFTHNDLDAEGCVVLAQTALGCENVDVEYCDYTTIDAKVKEYINSPEENNYDMTHITDISVSDELAREIDERFGNFILLDHHATALELNKYDWCCVQVNNAITQEQTSGTEMYYNWLVNNGYLEDSEVLGRFSDVVRNYDTWKWSTLGEAGLISRQVNDLLDIYGRERFLRWARTEIHDGVFPRLYSADEYVLGIRKAEIDEYVKRKNDELMITTLCGRVCGVVFAERFVSELGNKLSTMHTEVDFIVLINLGNGTVSYRTAKDGIHLGYDVAAKFGGGGHAKAAGSQIPSVLKEALIKDMFKGMVFHSAE